MSSAASSPWKMEDSALAMKHNSHMVDMNMAKVSVMDEKEVRDSRKVTGSTSKVDGRESTA